VSTRFPEDLFFSCVFRKNFSQEGGFGEAAGIPVFSAVTGIDHRNSCGTGIPVFTLDSSGFLLIPVPAKSMVRLMKAFC
jgi:hypothetical protein